jgi:hypothetical protein
MLREGETEDILKELEEQRKKISKLTELANNILNTIRNQEKFFEEKSVISHKDIINFLEVAKRWGKYKKNCCYYYDEGRVKQFNYLTEIGSG